MLVNLYGENDKKIKKKKNRKKWTYEDIIKNKHFW